MTKAKSSKTRKLKFLNLDFLLHNILIVVVCLLGMGLSLLIFYRDLRESLKLLEESPVGTVHWVENTVQRLSSRRIQWERVERVSPIYNGDTINTASLSIAKINFKNGERLELSENTSVQITYRNEETPNIDLYKGEIQVQSGREELLVTISGASDETVPGSSVQRAVLDPRTSAGIKVNNGSTLKLFQGSAEMTSLRETRPVSTGRALKVGNDGAFLEDPPMVVISPRNGTRLLRTSLEKAPVVFQWQKSNLYLQSGVWLEIAETGSFSSLVGSWYSEDKDSMEVDLPEGTFYWKVYMAPALEEVDSGRFQIIYSPGPRALSPADGSVQTFLRGSREQRFYWSVPEETEAVLLEVASNPEMSRPRLRQLIKMTNVGSGSYVSTELAPGQWYWRIHPVFPGGVSESDSISTLMGTGQNFWRVRPMNTDIIADNQPSVVNMFILEESQGQGIPAAVSHVSVKNTEPGDSPRLLFPPDNFTIESGRTPDLFFSWINPQDYSAGIQIAQRSDFSGPMILDESVFGSGIQSPFLKPGTYYWRITNTNAGDSGRTVPTRLVITPSLEAPRLDSPRDNERLLIEEGKAVSFNWERMDYANLYRFSLFLEGMNIPLTEISSLQNNSVLVFFDTGTTGRFRWTVQAFSSPSEISSGRNGLIAQGHFSIAPQAGSAAAEQVGWRIPRIANIQSYSGEVRSPITLISPPSGASVPGIQALRNPPDARWTSDEPLRNVQLIVSRNSDPSSDPMALIKDAGTSSVSFPPLSDGIWYWIIRGDTSTGRGATPGNSFWFTVLPIPLLPSPLISLPENGSIIDLVQLTRDRNIVFRWDEVEGANAYIMSLYQDSNPPSLVLATAPETILSYTLDNLSLLNQGDYLWQVEAVYRNRNGVIEQRGIIEQHRFTIDIQRSNNLQTQSLGTMYGQ